MSGRRTIPSKQTLETARSEIAEFADEAQSEAGDEPYFEFEILGVKYSYSKAAYWVRVILVTLVSIPLVAFAFADSGPGVGAFLALIMFGGIALSILLLHSYRSGDRSSP